MAKARRRTKRRGLGDILDDRIVRLRSQNLGMKLPTAKKRAKAQLCENGHEEYCVQERSMAKKKKAKKATKRKSPRKAPRKATKRKSARKSTGRFAKCKVVTVCGRRRRLCFKKKGKRIVIASNTAA